MSVLKTLIRKSLLSLPLILVSNQWYQVKVCNNEHFFLVRNLYLSHCMLYFLHVAALTLLSYKDQLTFPCCEVGVFFLGGPTLNQSSAHQFKYLSSF